MLLFRLGKDLLLGEAKNFQTDQHGTPLHHIQVKYVLGEGKWNSVNPVLAKVLGSFVVNEQYIPYEEHISESDSDSVNYADLVHENFSPLMGRKWVKFGDRKVVSYQKRGEGIGWLSEGESSVQWTAMHDILENGQVGQFMILEAVRPALEGMGLIDPAHRGPVQESFEDLTEQLHVYMKVNPFRDITRLNEGTPVAVLGYYRGCVMIEADGEIFYRPIEESTYWDKKQKDDEYYFTLDSNKDGIPDPIQALPSKSSFYSGPPRGVDNFNVQPELRKAAQHFGPNQNMLGEDDFGIIGESYLATNGFEDDERLQRPAIHDLAVEPGLDAADQDAQVAKDLKKAAVDTEYNDDGRDGVPQDYTGEYGDEDPPDDGTDSQDGVQEAMDLIMRGVDVNVVLGSFNEKERERMRDEIMKRSFPYL